MLLAIDPDLFTSSLQNKESRRAIEWLINNSDALEFAFDKPRHKQSVLHKEYADFLEQHLNKKDQLAIVFLDKLLNMPKSQTVKLDSSLTHDIEKLIEHRRCNEPVEPTLIGMGYHAPHVGLTILLTTQTALIRRRGLHDLTIQQEFLKQLPKLKVEYANPRISIPTLEAEEKTERDRWFEDKARLVVAQIFSGQALQKTPTPVMNAESVRGDVDVYVRQVRNDNRRVWIGECKLYKINESHCVEKAKLEQLEKRLPVVREYEQSKSDAATKLEIQAILISNAANMRSEAWQLAYEIGAIFWQVKLSGQWQQVGEWYIEEVCEYVPEQPFDEDSEWHGRFVRTIPIE